MELKTGLEFFVVFFNDLQCLQCFFVLKSDLNALKLQIKIGHSVKSLLFIV